MVLGLKCIVPCDLEEKYLNMHIYMWDNGRCIVPHDLEENDLNMCIEMGDSGASFHACHSREVMQNFRHYTGKVKLADNKTLDITGVGDVSVKTTLGTNWILKDVKFIPNLKRMLISVGQLDDEGHRIEFGDGQWKVTKGSMVIVRGRKRGTLYMVEVTDSEVNAVEEDEKTSTLWHQRLGHMSEKGMKILAS